MPSQHCTLAKHASRFRLSKIEMKKYNEASLAFTHAVSPSSSDNALFRLLLCSVHTMRWCMIKWNSKPWSLLSNCSHATHCRCVQVFNRTTSVHYRCFALKIFHPLHGGDEWLLKVDGWMIQRPGGETFWGRNVQARGKTPKVENIRLPH